MAQLDLWSLVQGTPSVDRSALLRAIAREVESGEHLDFRTRLLIRDSFNAIARHWGREQSLQRLKPAAREAIEAILASDLGEVGFPSLEHRLMEHTSADAFLEFLRELGGGTREPAKLEVGGAGALILGGYLSRATEDLDAVDQIPAALRDQHELLDVLANRYGLRLTHFQSHFLPQGWRDRLHSLGHFGAIELYLVDVHDIFVGKLFSNREKDRDDLRMLARQLDKSVLVERLLAFARSLMAEAKLRPNAERNWYILYGDQLPVPPHDP